MSARRTLRTLILAAIASPWLADAGAAPDARDTAEAGAAIRDAVARYAADVRNGRFPAEGQSFGMKDEVLKRVRESR